MKKVFIAVKSIGKECLNYYPFGMMMPGRTYQGAGDYRFGFNGKEKDNSFGATNYDLGARIYSPQIGRWLAVDPLQSKYPSLSPYNFAGNSPILFIDPDGEKIVNSRKKVLSSKTLIRKMRAFDLAVARISGKDVDSYTFAISGGDRYKGSDGRIYSSSNQSHISKSSKRSQHLQEEGAPPRARLALA